MERVVYRQVAFIIPVEMFEAGRKTGLTHRRLYEIGIKTAASNLKKGAK
jgi:hypothetical protein